MCDQAKLQKWATAAINRRQFGSGVALAGGAATITACAPMATGTADAGALAERSVTFAIGENTMDGFFVHPASGTAPGVMFWPDIAGLRESKRVMARRMAANGYAVLVLNPYYRDVSGEQFSDFADFVAQEGFAQVGPWRAKLSSDAIMADSRAIVSWLDRQDAVDSNAGIGAQGYCMGGPFTVYSANAVPGRVRAAGSFHGGGLVRDDVASPHRLLADSNASYLFAIAQDDDAEAPDHKTVLRQSANAAGRSAVVDVYAADHGWTVPDSPAYDQPEAERAWAALLALYSQAL